MSDEIRETYLSKAMGLHLKEEVPTDIQEEVVSTVPQNQVKVKSKPISKPKPKPRPKLSSVAQVRSIQLPTRTTNQDYTCYIYYNSDAFLEIAQSLQYGLAQKSIQAKLIDYLDFKLFSPETLFIILGLNNPIGKLPSKYIAYQLEQTGNQVSWFSQSYLQKLSGALEIWDYSIRNIQNLKKYQFPCPVKYVPLGYTPNLERIKLVSEPDKKYDILFYGSSNSRRDILIDKLRNAGLKVYYGQYSLWRDERDRLIAQSKIVLNIHFYENPTLETSRLTYLLANRAFIISEPSLDPILDKAYGEMAVFAPYDQMVDKCLYYLQHESERLQIAKNGYDKFTTNHLYELTLPMKVFEQFSESLKKSENDVVEQEENEQSSQNQNLYMDSLEDKSTTRKSPMTQVQQQAEYQVKKKNQKREKFVHLSNEIFEVSTGFYELLDEHTCPKVSIVTPTARRSWAIPVAVRNFLHTYYPAEKLEWIILDSEPTEQICLPDDPRIIYKEIDASIPLWKKRNMAVELATGEVIVHMDDDDYYFPQHVWVKVNLLHFLKTSAKYKERNIQCVGTTSLGIYHLLDHYSYLSQTNHLSEASMAYTKEFWQTRPFSAKHEEMGEGYAFLVGRESQVADYPYHHNFIALTHGQNYTGRLRTYRNNTGELFQNFFNLWDTETQVFFLELKNKLKKLINS